MINIFSNGLLFCETHFKKCILVYTVVQLSLLFKFPLPYSSDSAYFFRLVQECIAGGIYYPAPQHLYHDYLVAPVFVNLQVVLLNMWNSQITIGLMNCLLNLIQIYILYQLGETLFNKRIAVIACILYMLYLNNLAMVLMNFNDLLFTVLITTAFWFYLRKKLIYLLLGGVLTGLAMGVRPFAVAVLGAIILHALVYWYKKKQSIVPSVFFTVSAIVTMFIIGFTLRQLTGTFVYTSNFSGLNLIIGASDDCRGGFQARVFDLGKAGYIENIEQYPHTYREEYWQKQAVTWIQEHPFRWAALFPVKIARMYLSDDYAVSRLFFTKYSIYHTFRYLRDGEPIPVEDAGFPAIYFALWISVITVHHAFYFLVLLGSILALYEFGKKLWNNEPLKLLLIYWLFGLFFTGLAYGETRYKYPYLFIQFILLAYLLGNLSSSAES